MFKRSRAQACALFGLALALAACASTSPVPPIAAPTAVAQASATAGSAQMVTVRVAMLPILDALPMYVAMAQGYFAAQNINVQVVPAASAAERDQLIQAGQADAMINDLVSTLFYNRDHTSIAVVRFARTASSKFAQYFILAGGTSGITDVNGLKGVPIAISDGTVIAYITDRLLQAEGLSQADIKTVAMPKIADRLAALSGGTVKAATIPDPTAAAAMAAGAKVIVSDAAHPQYGNSVLSFTADFVGKNPDTVRGFLAAWEKGVADVNADKTKWNTVLSTNNLLSPALLGKYTLPDYPTASVPTEAQFKDVNDWAKQKGLLSVDVSYAQSVNATFLPK
jgi:NitT/TauT family transport system substrate-binding protein